jgi:hypothetical protein
MKDASSGVRDRNRHTITEEMSPWISCKRKRNIIKLSSHYRKEQLNPWRLLWEVGGFPAHEDIPRFLWAPVVHCRVPKGPPLKPIVSRLNPVCSSIFFSFKIRLNVIVAPSWLKITYVSQGLSLSVSFLIPDITSDPDDGVRDGLWNVDNF